MVTSMPCDSLEAKQQMLTECRAYYRNDRVTLSQIDQFERIYQPSDAIRWYTKSGFLFYLVNKALRSGDILALYTFRYFIKDLCNRLEEASAEHSNTSFRLYRGAKLHREEVESLQIGSFVATNGFFSCSCTRSVAEMFISIDPLSGKSPSRDRDEKEQFALFEINVDIIKSPDVVVVNASAQSVFPDEKEMIFTLGSTFIINHIVYDGQKNLWFIEMSSFSDWAKIDQEYDRYIRVRLQLTNPTILFGHALANIRSEYLQSLDYFHRLLRTLSIDHADRPNVHYNLGRIYRILEKYQKGLAYFRCAQLLLRRLLPQRIFDYCRVLSAIGSIYSKLGDSKRAINLLEQALTLQRNSLPDNHTEIPFHLNRLGHGYFNAKQYERALSILYSADSFFQTRMPVDHQGHAQTLHILGLVYRALDDEEKAYSYFKEALRKRDSLLAKDHPDVASTCYQLSLMCEDRGEYELALEYAKRSLRIQSMKLPYYHSELKQSSELVERLQQRQKVLDTT
jgi:tetratricopeptide (TPR) repeat protein